MQRNVTAVIILSILKTPWLRGILIGCFIITILLPTYSTFFIMPLFVEQLAEDTKDNARRTAKHLLSKLSPANGRITKDSFSKETMRDIQESIKDFKLERVKVFSGSGEVVYSSDEKDIGSVNKNEYFREIVDKGRYI